WLAIWLQRMGAQIVGLALPPPPHSLFELADVGRHMVSIESDVRDLASVQQVVDDVQPEIVFHLAAQALVRASYANPLETYTTNVLGTVSLLEALRNSSCCRVVVNVTTDKCYLNPETPRGYTEAD